MSPPGGTACRTGQAQPIVTWRLLTPPAGLARKRQPENLVPAESMTSTQRLLAGAPFPYCPGVAIGAMGRQESVHHLPLFFTITLVTIPFAVISLPLGPAWAPGIS